MDFNTSVQMPAHESIEEFAEEITSEILTKCEGPLLYRITEHEFPYVSPSQQLEIYNTALKNASPESGDILNTMHYNRRKALIEESAIDYLRENSSIIINGFINFRLEEYKNELRKLCHSAAEEVSAMREYDDFLNMLRFFVSVQTPKESTVHIMRKDNTLRVFNRWHKDITDFYASEFAFSPEEFTHEDIALSALITISPRHIIIHDNKENDKIYETIDSVFSNVEFKSGVKS